MPLLPPEMDRRSTRRPTEMYSDSKGSQAMRDIAKQPSSRPTAILIISAHWEEHGTIAVSSAAQPPMVYDYGGFPPETYQYQYRAPGSPQLAQRVQALIRGAGHDCRLDGRRGFDHGVFVPMMLAYPDADIPVVSVSLQRNLDPSLHYSVGEALQPLRDEGVLIIGSGVSFHNFSAFSRSHQGPPKGARFDAALTAAVTSTDTSARKRALLAWENMPEARFAHPAEEHLIPLMVVAGAAGADVGVKNYEDVVMGCALAGFRFG